MDKKGRIYMAKEKTKAQLLAENKELRRTKLRSSVTEIVIALIRYGAIVACVYFLSTSISTALTTLAGKTTSANILVNLLGNLNLSNSIATLFGGGGIAYGLMERRQRQNMIQRQHGRVKKMEQQIDPNRSSSNITEKGDTNPKDY